MIWLGLVAVWICGTSVQAWWNSDYTLRKQITIDTSSNGSAISDPIGTVPVLIRLSGDFSFDAAKPDGSDLRFIAGDDKTPLAFHIEKFDPLLGEGFVWIKVADLQPGQKKTVYLYYGNSNSNVIAPGGADTKGTYDSDTVLVYHFAEGGNNPRDYSGNNNDADSAAPSTDAAIIGPGLQLDGKTAVKVKPSDSLNWTDGASVTWSAWAKLSSLSPNTVLLARRDGSKDLVIGVDNDTPFIEINGQRFPANVQVAAGAWKHFAVVGDSSKVTFYLDGVVAATANVPLPGFATGLTVGGDAEGAGGTNDVVGEMDEVTISKVARPAGFVRFESLGEGGDSSKLVSIGGDESHPAGWFSGAFGLFGVILKSVTIDGWAVISVLGIMSVISWYVMVTKLFYLLAVAKGNQEFLKHWYQVASDLTALDHRDDESLKSMGGRLGTKALRLMRNAPLYKVYHIGAEEIVHRLSDAKHGGSLSAESMQAIRASLDSGLVRQMHRLNSGLVFLTISIAGGPFMGLLGTVVGVMITFAAIAATGEVNISAIAPGLAAALVATVAGLLVAIPALLGYNYLLSQIKDVTADLQMFIDEFVTKMAEFYRPETRREMPGDVQIFVDEFLRQIRNGHRPEVTVPPRDGHAVPSNH